MKLLSKRTLLTFLFVLFACMSQAATDVIVSLADSRLNIDSATNRTVWIQRESVPDSPNATTILIGSKLTYTTDATGSFTVTNMMSGVYSARVLAPPEQTNFRFLITATNLGTVYAADLLVASATSTFPAGAVAWSAAVTDNRYSRSTNNLTNYVTLATLTNALTLYQPTNNVLTQFGTLTTNAFPSTNTFVTTTNALYLFSQTLSTNATNYTITIGGNTTNFVLSTSNSLLSALAAQGLVITNIFYPRSNPSNYVTASVTNGYALQAYVQTATNTLWGSLGTAARSNASAFYLDSNPSNYVTSTITNALNARLGTAAFSNTAAFYLASNPSGYITTAATNGFAQQAYVQTLTNTLWLLLGTAARSNASAFYLDSNPSNYVTSTITNALNTSLGTAARSNATAFYLNSNPSNYISTAATNGFAQQAYVQSLTNSLWLLLGTAARSNASAFYLDSNPSNYVTSTITNALNASLGTAARSNANAFYSAGNPSGYITQAATNGFAQQTYVQTLTNTLWLLLGTAARSNASAFYLDSNPSNYVTATVTNALNARLGTAAFSNASIFMPNSLTNLFLPTNQFNLTAAKDASVSSLSAGQGLFWSGTAWTNGAPPNTAASLAGYMLNTAGIGTNSLTMKGHLFVYTNLFAATATFTNAVTNLALTASRFMATDANKVESSTAASSALSGTLSDETGTGVAVFSSGSSVTNMVSTNATLRRPIVNNSVQLDGATLASSYEVTVIDGGNTAVPVTANTFVSLSGNATNALIYGFVPYHADYYQIIHVINGSSTNHVFIHDSTDAVTNRFSTIGGANVTNRPGGVLSFVYDPGVSLWRPLLNKEQ